MEARERLIVALDHPTLEPALAQVDRLGEAALFYKVGLELFIAEGRKAVDSLRQRHKRVFLDLKLHDIPETVARATRNAVASGAELLTIHASGGLEMMKRAVEAAGQAKVLAVTVLTSLDLADLQRDGSGYRSTEEAVVQRARLAAEAGCAGVIASPLEVKAIRQVLPAPFLVVTPGVRRADISSGKDDQKRVATPRQARADGADMIVVGRPIRDADDPVAEARRIVEELA